MSWIMNAGGAPAWFVALFGIIALLSAIQFAYRPSSQRLEFVRHVSRATLWSTLAGIVADLAAVFFHVPHHPEWSKSPTIHLIVMEGLAESMAPGILGFTLLALVAFITAFGVRRMPRV